MPYHFTLLDWSILTFDAELKLCVSSYAIFSSLLLPVNFSNFVPNVLLSTLSSNAFYLCPSFKVAYQVSHPYKTTKKKLRFEYVNLALFMRSTMKYSLTHTALRGSVSKSRKQKSKDAAFKSRFNYCRNA